MGPYGHLKRQKRPLACLAAALGLLAGLAAALGSLACLAAALSLLVCIAAVLGPLTIFLISYSCIIFLNRSLSFHTSLTYSLLLSQLTLIPIVFLLGMSRLSTVEMIDYYLR